MTAQRWSRRKFLITTAATAAGTATSGITRSACAYAQQVPRASNVDVAIVGAGISGLTTARELVKAGIDNIVVLEARDRVGGRTYNHDIGKGHVAEGGGQWVGPTQTAILELCEELGVGTFETYLKGNLIYRTGAGQMEVPYPMSGQPLTPTQKRIDQLAATVPLNAPWKAERAEEWDAISLADWARANGVRGEALGDLQTAAALTLGSSAEQLSFLYFLYYVHSAGSLHDLETMKGGAQDSRIEGGSQILSIKMAEALGDKVRLSSPVSRIVQSDDGVLIETAGAKISAKQLVMALMPGSCTHIQFEPHLPEARAQLQKKSVQRSSGVKYNVVYDRPFWRERGLNGMLIGDAGPLGFTTDNSPPDGSLGVILVITGIEGLGGTLAARKKRIVTELADVFGEQANDVIGFHEMDWGGERYTAGCVSPLAPGVLTQYGAALRESVGRIHWAGTETAEVWTGYMDGAVRAGRHTAKRIAALVQT